MHPRLEFIAHRGSSFLAPENTLAAFALGWQETTTCECDIRLTRDGKWLVIHDESALRTAGVDLLIAEHTLAELQQLNAGAWKGARWQGEKLPSLEETIAAMPEGKRLLIEVKSGGEALPEFTRILRASDKIANIAMQSFSLEICAAARDLLPEISIHHLVAMNQDAQTLRWSSTLDETISTATALRLNGIGTNDTKLLSSAAVRAVHAAGLKLNIWTVDDPTAAQQLAEFGVNGLITNRPGWLAARPGA